MAGRDHVGAALLRRRRSDCFLEGKDDSAILSTLDFAAGTHRLEHRDASLRFEHTSRSVSHRGFLLHGVTPGEQGLRFSRSVLDVFPDSTLLDRPVRHCRQSVLRNDSALWLVCYQLVPEKDSQEPDAHALRFHRLCFHSSGGVASGSRCGIGSCLGLSSPILVTKGPAWRGISGTWDGVCGRDRRIEFRPGSNAASHLPGSGRCCHRH